MTAYADAQADATLRAIVSFVDKRGYPPTVRELGEALGVKSPSDVHRRLCTLVDRGDITHEPGKPRTIRVVKR